MEKYLAGLELTNNDAVHIGDSIRYNYDAMKHVGIETILIDAPYNIVLEVASRIQNLNELIADPHVSVTDQENS